jgi:predicted lipopolysaccharide heptosyltransferase III
MYKIINRKKLVATALADAIGKALFSPRRLFRRNPEIRPEEIRDILVIRTAYIGDVVMTLPVLKPLKETFRNARVSFLTSDSAGELLKGNPHIDEIITFNPSWFYSSGKGKYIGFIRKMREKPFDMVIEARGDIREILLIAWPLKTKVRISYKVGGGGYMLTHVVPYPGLKHKVQYHLDIVRHLGAEVDDIDWGVYLMDEEKKRVREMLDKHDLGGKFIAVHPGTRLHLKRWIRERYVILYDSLIKRYKMPLLALGTKTEKPIVDEIVGDMEHPAVNLAGETGLRELAGIIENASLFICNDSGPMHIAASVGTPTVALFGPSKSVETGPYGDMHRVVEKDFPCRAVCDESSCRYSRFHACMEDIGVDEVLHAVGNIMGES